MYCLKSPFVILLASPLLLWSATADAQGLGDFVNDPGLHPCKGVDLRCFTLEVPVDHRANTGPTIKIEYAISFASQPSKGIVVFAAGGPGESGLEFADAWLSSYRKDLTENMDVVFFDQRGVGPDHGVTCPLAKTTFNMAQPSIGKPDDAIAIAKRYATDCPEEFKSRDLINFLDTDQAVRDLELFRQAVGSPKIWVYGMSYGTQFAQRYATIFPTSVKGVIIDGVVDLNLDFDGYYATYVQAAEGILTRIFEKCRAIDDCNADTNGNPAGIYNELVARAKAEPLAVKFPLATGGFANREMTANMIETSAFGALYGPDQRAEFLRALAAASRNNLLPLLQLSYSELSVDPETLDEAEDPSNFPAAYYAITCSDYGEGTANAEDTARQIMQRAKAFAPKAPRLLEFFYMERLACAFWPKRGPKERPRPYAGGEFPTLVLNADADPITPLVMSESVFGNAENAHTIIMKNGPHVIWGWGESCVDDPVYSLLIESKMPARTTRCEQPLLGDYTRLTLTDAASTGDVRAVVRAVEMEIKMSRQLRKWNGKDALTVGCDFGGTVTASAGTAGTEYSFANCAWWPQILVDGKATKGSDKGSEILTLDFAISGEHSGTLIYRRDGDPAGETLTGIYDGKDVSLQ